MGHTDGHTVLQVPVPELEPFVRERTAYHDADWLFPDAAHAHVTALGPWLVAPGPDDLARVGAIAGSVPPFAYRLDRLATFPTGIIHLVPSPSTGFAELTARLMAAYPQCPPYAGEFAPTPHLTLDLATDTVDEASTRQRLGDLVPAVCRAERLDLAWYAAGDCRLLASWPLGG